MSAEGAEQARQRVLRAEEALERANALTTPERVRELEAELEDAAEAYERALEGGDAHSSAYLTWCKANSTEVLP